MGHWVPKVNLDVASQKRKGISEEQTVKMMHDRIAKELKTARLIPWFCKSWPRNSVGDSGPRGQNEVDKWLQEGETGIGLTLEGGKRSFLSRNLKPS